MIQASLSVDRLSCVPTALVDKSADLDHRSHQVSSWRFRENLHFGARSALQGFRVKSKSSDVDSGVGTCDDVGALTCFSKPTDLKPAQSQSPALYQAILGSRFPSKNCLLPAYKARIFAGSASWPLSSPLSRCCLDGVLRACGFRVDSFGD